MEASNFGHLGVVQALLAVGVDLEAEDEVGDDRVLDDLPH